MRLFGSPYSALVSTVPAVEIGDVIAGATNSQLILSSYNLIPNDVIECSYSVTDNAEAAASAALDMTIENRAPQNSGSVVVAGTIEGEAAGLSVVSCSVDEDTTDEDGEALVETYLWYDEIQDSDPGLYATSAEGVAEYFDLLKTQQTKIKKKS